jgi:hypothetical protein
MLREIKFAVSAFMRFFWVKKVEIFFRVPQLKFFNFNEELFSKRNKEIVRDYSRVLFIFSHTFLNVIYC